MAFQCMRSSSTALTVHHSGEFFSNSASSYQEAKSSLEEGVRRGLAVH